MQLESVETATTLQRRLHAEHKRRQAKWEATARDMERGKVIPIIQIIQSPPISEEVVVVKTKTIEERIEELTKELKVLCFQQSKAVEQDFKRYQISIEMIQRVVCRFYSVKRCDVLSSRRTADVVRPRQVAMYLAKILTMRSLPQIGRMFGGRDHTTALHAIRKIGALRLIDSDLCADLAFLESQFVDQLS